MDDEDFQQLTSTGDVVTIVAVLAVSFGVLGMTIAFLLF